MIGLRAVCLDRVVVEHGVHFGNRTVVLVGNAARTLAETVRSEAAVEKSEKTI